MNQSNNDVSTTYLYMYMYDDIVHILYLLVTHRPAIRFVLGDCYKKTNS